LKRLFPVLLTVSLLLSPVSILEAQAADITVKIDETHMFYDQLPVILNGTTMVPFRLTFEMLGAKVTWDEATKTVTAEKRNVTVTLQVGSKIAYKNGQAVQLSQAVQLLGGRTLVPLRFVGEALGGQVEWDGATSTVNVISAEGVLLKAVRAGDAMKVKQLLAAGAAPDWELNEGSSVLDAAFSDHAEILQLLQEAGADLNRKYYSTQWTALHAAADNDAKNALLMLLQAGVDVNAKRADGKTAMMLAARNLDGGEEILELLGAGADPNLQDKFGATALHIALREKNLNAATWLLDGGADPLIATFIGETPLSHALIYNRDPQALQMLIEAGIDVTDSKKHGTGLLNTVITYNNTPMLKALLAAGVDPNRYPDRPPLVQAAFKGDVEAVKALIEAKANLFSKTADGHTAMMMALAANRQDVVALLRQAGDTTSTLPSDLPRFDEGAEIKRLQGLLHREVMDGQNPYNDFGLDRTESLMLLEIPFEDDREAFFNLSEHAQKEVILGYFKEYYKEHSAELFGAKSCYTYITWDREAIAGAELTPEMETEDVELIIGPRVPLR